MTHHAITSITDGQKKQYKRFVEDAGQRALERCDLDKDGLQKLIEQGDKFQLGIHTLIQELSMSNQFADEEVESSYDYLSGYQPKPIAEQMRVLRELFPELDTARESLAEADLSPNAEGWFAIPRWEKIAKTYGQAVQKMLDLISVTRNSKFHNYHDDQLGPQYLRQHERTTAVLKRLGERESDHNILVVSAQFGLRHRGRSVRRAREVMGASEFGLGSFHVACMILTHPERLQHYDDLWIDCAGDEFAPGADRSFSSAPYFSFDDGEVRFGTDWIGSPSDDYGSVSGFVPQS